MKLVFLVYFLLLSKQTKVVRYFRIEYYNCCWFFSNGISIFNELFKFFLSTVFFFSSYLIFPWVVRISCFLSDFGMNEWMIADSNSTWDWHIICIFSYNVFYLLCARISICSSSSEFRHITKSHLATFSPLPFPSTHSGWQKQTFFVSYLLAIYPVLKHNKFRRFFSSSLLSRNKRKKFASEMKLVCLVCKYAVMWFTQTRTQLWPAMFYRPILLVLVNCI